MQAEQTESSPLRRTVGFWALVFYGLSVIVGAGIYVAIGAVILRAGNAAPVSFLLAGAAAALTGLCYAELAGRFPEAGGAASYVRHGFDSDRMAQLVGAAVTLAVAIAAASIARGAAQYMAALITLPEPLLITGLILAFILIAAAGVRESVALAAITGVVELLGLAAVVAAGLIEAPSWHPGALLPTEWANWSGILAGAFIAFFAFIGFETLANMAEEVRDPHRNVPRGIVCAVVASVGVYVVVAGAVVLSGRAADAPLLDVFRGRAATWFAVVGFMAVANGVLVHIIMLSRLFYGMARNQELPAFLARVDPRTRTPVIATVLAGSIVLGAALTLPFDKLLLLTNALTLVVFAWVDLALWQVKRRTPAHVGGFCVPGWLPPVAAIVSIGLIFLQFLA